MKRLLNVMIRLMLILSGFLFIFNVPSLIGIGKASIQFNFGTFWLDVKSNFLELVHFQNSKYQDFLKQLHLGESYRYTMTILIVCLLVVMILAMLIAILVVLAPPKISNRLKIGINFFEGVPDLLIIFLFQFFVITLYKTYGLKYLQLYGNFGLKPYFIPIVTISFLPLFLFTQFLIKVFEEEQKELYALYSTAKGLGRFRILVVHILRNVFPLFILQLRTTMWFILSNIYLVEYMCNIDGFTKVFQKIFFMGGDFVSLVICLVMYLIPLLIIEAVGLITSRFLRGKETMSI